ncbi:hypothetical protein PINS_up006371 [Pythium insidiosum]|nr:hypothetical protein PINS_up006371 [Pythium insidiosum]
MATLAHDDRRMRRRLSSARIGEEEVGDAMETVDLHAAAELKQRAMETEKEKDRLGNDRVGSTASTTVSNALSSPVASGVSSSLSASLLRSRVRVAQAVGRALRDGFFGNDEEETKDEEETPEAEHELSVSVDNDDRYRTRTRNAPPAVVPQVPLLLRRRLLPKNVSPVARLWIFLDRIECIAIRDVVYRDDDAVHFVLEVFLYQEQCRLPLNHESTLQPAQPVVHRSADFVLEKRYSNFSTLRNRLWGAAREQQHHHKCAYCKRVARYLATSESQPSWRMKFMTTTEQRKTLLSQFVSDLVGLVRHRQWRHECTRLNQFPSCAPPSNAQLNATLPGVLRRFLTAQTGENFMS